MARKKKLRYADTVKHHSGLSVDILYDPNELEFESRFQGQTHRMESAKDLRRRMYQILERAAELEFKPVIIVFTLKPFANLIDPFVGISTRRRYIAKAKDGHLRVIDWDTWERHLDDEDWGPISASKYEYWNSERDGEFTLPYIKDNVMDSNVKAMYYLLYSEELWEGLQELKRGIEQLRLKLCNLLGSDDGIKMITDVGGDLMRLLPAGDVASDEKEGEIDG